MLLMKNAVAMFGNFIDFTYRLVLPIGVGWFVGRGFESICDCRHAYCGKGLMHQLAIGYGLIAFGATYLFAIMIEYLRTKDANAIVVDRWAKARFAVATGQVFIGFLLLTSGALGFLLFLRQAS